MGTKSGPEDSHFLRYASDMRTLLVLVLALTACPAAADVIVGRVIEVPDGGTFTVLAREGTSLHRVRLAGIEAPKPNSAIGISSRDSLRKLVRGKTVRVETSAIDPKGLLVGVVQVMRDPKECTGAPCEERLDPGLAQLAAGFAKIDKSNLAFQSEDTQRQYDSAQVHAKASKTGLWRPAPQPARADFRYGEAR